MQSSEFPHFARQIMALSELYKYAVSEVLMEMYWNMLKSYPYEEIERAIYQHGRNPDQGRYMPKPADLVKILEGGSQTKAQLAWSKVHRAMRNLGSGKSVVFDDALIHAVIQDMEGWIKLCGIDDKALPFKTREFEQRYMAYLLNPPPDYPKRLCGYVEQQNSAHGHEKFNPEVQLLGDTQKALEVQQNGSELETRYQALGLTEALKLSQLLPQSKTEEGANP